MADKPEFVVTSPFNVYSTEGLVPNPPANAGLLKEFTNNKTGATIASGLVTFNDRETSQFTLWYDEVLLLHTCEGEFELDYDGKAHPMKVGDIAWIRAGTTVVYRSRGGASTLFYAVTPADWDARRPG